MQWNDATGQGRGIKSSVVKKQALKGGVLQIQQVVTATSEDYDHWAGLSRLLDELS